MIHDLLPLAHESFRGVDENNNRGDAKIFHNMKASHCRVTASDL